MNLRAHSHVGGWDSSLFSPGMADVGQYIHVQGLLGQSTTHWVA